MFRSQQRYETKKVKEMKIRTLQKQRRCNGTTISEEGTQQVQRICTARVRLHTHEPQFQRLFDIVDSQEQKNSSNGVHDIKPSSFWQPFTKSMEDICNISYLNLLHNHQIYWRNRKRSRTRTGTSPVRKRATANYFDGTLITSEEKARINL